MYHVVIQRQDSTVTETDADYDLAMQIYGDALNDPGILICNAFEVGSLGTWLYFICNYPTLPATTPAGIELPPEFPVGPGPSEAPEPFKVTIRNIEGFDFTGEVLATHEAAEETVLWILTDDGTYTIAGASQILPEAPADLRAIVDQQEIGPKVSRNLERFEEVTAYTHAGDITGPRVEALAIYPLPDFVQILVENTVFVVHALALNAPEAQAPAPAPESVAGAGAFPDTVSTEEEARRNEVMTQREALLRARATGEADIESQALTDLKAALDALAQPWPVAIAIRRDIGHPEKATEKAAQADDTKNGTDTPKTENTAPRAKKTGKAAK